jgi:hypothetical protein
MDGISQDFNMSADSEMSKLSCYLMRSEGKGKRVREKERDENAYL